jgi:hypothetical protein
LEEKPGNDTESRLKPDDLEPLDLERVKTHSLSRAGRLVQLKGLARPLEVGATITGFLDSLPDVLAARDLKTVVSRLVTAVREQRMVMFGLGAHNIKCGLSPIYIDLMERGVISLVAMNGGAVIHDFEMAYAGKTSEDVPKALEEGTFGMARDTSKLINEAISEGVAQGLGLGAAVGQKILDLEAPHSERSILAVARRLGIPATVHVAVGTDIIHMHPSASGADIGQASHLDFKRFCTAVNRIRGGAYLNVGSAVILPEVFLKALALARNFGAVLAPFLTATFDFNRHYRPETNVLARPRSVGADSFGIVGHHELMIPLLAAAVIEGLAASPEGKTPAE